MFALLLLCTLPLCLAPGLLAQDPPPTPATPAETPAPAEPTPAAEETPPAGGTPPTDAASPPPADGTPAGERTDTPPATTLLEDFEKRASEVRSAQAAQELVDETFAAKDTERLAICMKHPALLNFATQKYAAEPPSEFKDKLTIALIDRPWDTDPGAPTGRLRTVPPPNPFQPYAQYIQSRVKGVMDPRSKDQVQRAGTSQDERNAIAHKFERALTKADLSSIKGKPSARPRKDGKPADLDEDRDESGDASAGGDTGGNSMGLRIGVGAALLLAVAGFFAFRRQGREG